MFVLYIFSNLFGDWSIFLSGYGTLENLRISSSSSSSSSLEAMLGR